LKSCWSSGGQRVDYFVFESLKVLVGWSISISMMFRP
jgi:hypothetical protein